MLRQAGLVEQGREAQWRPCRLQPAPLQGVADWLEQYRHIWEERYERLDDYLDKLQADESEKKEKQG